MSTIKTRSCTALALLLLVAGVACGDADLSTQQRSDDDSAPDAWSPTTGPTEDAGVAASPDGEADATADARIPTIERTRSLTLETEVKASSLEVGSTFDVTCRLLDTDGNRVQLDETPEFELQYTPRDAFESPSNLKLEPTAAGEADVACKAPSLNLVDRSPAEITIAAGSAHTVRTELDKHRVTAGETVQATCRVYDQFGNRLENASPEVRVDAQGGNVSVNGRKVTIEASGIYMVTCHVGGAEREIGDTLEVQPGLPAQLALTPQPSRSVYGLGQVVHFQTLVTDRFGNRVEQVSVDVGSQPSGNAFGYHRYQFDTEGTYDVNATVEGKTYKDRDLSKTVQITVNGEGPDIRCRTPSSGAVLDRDPSGGVTFKGKVEDANGVKKLVVNGDKVNVNNNGRFSTQLDTEFGINFVDLKATDSYDEKNSRTCAFLIADRWNSPGKHLDDGVSMRLDQDAVDDDNRRDRLDSFADLVARAITSDGVKERIGRALLNANPLNSGPTVKYKAPSYDPDRGIQLKNLKRIDLNWTNDGLSMDAKIGQVGIKIKGKQSLLVTDVTVTGWIRVKDISLDFDLDLGLQNGRLDASVDKRSVRVDARRVEVDIGDFFGAGALESIVNSLAQGLLQDTVEGQLESFIKGDLDSLLDNVFSSLDIDSIGQSFQAPSLAGSGQTEVDFGVRFSSVDTQRGRALVGVGTQFETSNRSRAGGSQGVPLPNGNILLDPRTNKAVGVGVHLGIVNQVLHTLWRGGMFDADLGKSLLGSSVPKGTKVELKLGLPPVAKRKGSNDKVELMIGGATLKLVYPGIFNKPIDVEVGLIAETKVDIRNGDELYFSKIKLTKFFFSPRDISLSPEARSTLESFLRELFQNVVDRSLNSALPSLPIPSFTLPSSVGQYGLPAGKKLGIERPGLDTRRHHFLLTGDFGIR